MNRISRYGIYSESTETVSGDFLAVDGVDLGCFRDLVQAEYCRAARENSAMRPMWYTGSPFADEIWKLVDAVRGPHIREKMEGRG
jgi:hypothetical protein